jgi:hypothetical protein
MNAPESQGRSTTEPTRVTPYELAFGEVGFEERLFPAIEAEARRMGIDPIRLDLFTLLGSATEALNEIIPEEAPPDAREQHRVNLFHVFNFWRFGKRLYLLDSAVARYLVEAAPSIAHDTLVVPSPAVYLQLPANLFWASIAPDTPPEPVDGFFVATFDGTDTLGDPYRHLHALMVLGIRRNRAGFSAIPFETESGPGIATEWVNAPARDSGRDFENVLPGGEMAGMYSILTTAEALKLLMRAFEYIHAHPEDVAEQDIQERPADAQPGTVRHSRLPFFRVRLGQRAAGDGEQGG